MLYIRLFVTGIINLLLLVKMHKFNESVTIMEKLFKSYNVFGNVRQIYALLKS